MPKKKSKKYKPKFISVEEWMKAALELEKKGAEVTVVGRWPKKSKR